MVQSVAVLFSLLSVAMLLTPGSVYGCVVYFCFDLWRFYLLVVRFVAVLTFGSICDGAVYF
jgi:hypothetical protein